MNKLDVVAGITIRDDGTRKRLLLIQRRDNQRYPGAWCCPGGKVQEGETGFDALEREAGEELVYIDEDGACRSVCVSVVLNPCTLAVTDEAEISYHFVKILNDLDRVSHNMFEAQGSGWFSTAELSALSLTPGDDQIRHKLQELLEA